MNTTAIKNRTKLFKALSDPNRLRILKMLKIKPLCVCEITDVLQLAPSTVSKHLSILKENGFIIEEREGKWVNYIINNHSSDARVPAILSSLDFWIAEDPITNSDKLKVIKADRNEICSR